MWHPYGGLSEWPRKQVTVCLIHSELKISCPVEVKQLTQKCGEVTQSNEAMGHAAVRVYERGCFVSTARWKWLIQRWRIIEINWLICYPCNDKLIVGAPEEMGSGKGTAGSHLPVAPVKLVSPHSTQSLTRTKGLYTTYSLKETSQL